MVINLASSWAILEGQITTVHEATIREQGPATQPR